MGMLASRFCLPKFFMSFNQRRNYMIPNPTELLIIAGVALLLFGPSKLPQLGSAIGESIRNFRKGMKPNEDAEGQSDTQNSQVLLSQPNKTQVLSSQTPTVQQG